MEIHSIPFLQAQDSGKCLSVFREAENKQEKEMLVNMDFLNLFTTCLWSGNECVCACVSVCMCEVCM